VIELETAMRAIILAGGKGTRLRPFTATIPKPLVPIGDTAIMDVLLKRLVLCGCERATVAVGHMSQLIMAYYGDGAKWGLALDYCVEEQPLSTIGPLTLIKDLPDDFLVMNGDLLTDLDFGALFRAHVESGAVGTVAVKSRELKIDFGVLGYDDTTRRLTSFAEKPSESFSVSMGIYAFSKRVMEHVPHGRPFGFDDLMLACLAGGVDVRAYPYAGYWLDIGRPDDYEQANRDFPEIREKLFGKP
jgi:NDP-sugar pyrophosphorylase family protein